MYIKWQIKEVDKVSHDILIQWDKKINKLILLIWKNYPIVYQKYFVYKSIIQSIDSAPTLWVLHHPPPSHHMEDQNIDVALVQFVQYNPPLIRH